MATKVKMDTETAAQETAEAITKASSDAVRKGIEKTVELTKSHFEKTAKGLGDVAAFNKDNVEALVKSANATAKALESINAEILAYSKQSVEDSIAATKAMMSARSVKEFFELQTDYSKTTFDSFVNESTKLTDLMVGATKEAFAPIQSRVTAAVEKVQSLRPAL